MPLTVPFVLAGKANRLLGLTSTSPFAATVPVNELVLGVIVPFKASELNAPQPAAVHLLYVLLIRGIVPLNEFVPKLKDMSTGAAEPPVLIMHSSGSVAPLLKPIAASVPL